MIERLVRAYTTLRLKWQGFCFCDAVKGPHEHYRRSL